MTHLYKWRCHESQGIHHSAGRNKDIKCGSLSICQLWPSPEMCQGVHTAQEQQRLAYEYITASYNLTSYSRPHSTLCITKVTAYGQVIIFHTSYFSLACPGHATIHHLWRERIMSQARINESIFQVNCTIWTQFLSNSTASNSNFINTISGRWGCRPGSREKARHSFSECDSEGLKTYPAPAHI